MSVALPPVPEALARRLVERQAPQRPFRWIREKWLPVVADIADAQLVLRELPPELGREEVRSVVQDQLAADRAIAAFVPVMIWGGPGGYGPFRTRRILTGHRTSRAWSAPIDHKVAPRLVEAARVVREEGPIEAFRVLNNTGHIKYLGGSFFTKWMSFASAAASSDAEEVAPILDRRVSGWIETNTRDSVRMSLSTSSTADYARYLDLLDAWRMTSGWTRTRVQVELAIFELARDRPDST